MNKFKTNYRSTQELRQPFGGSSEKINQRQLNEKFMNQTAAGSAQSGRRVKLEEHHENIKDELHHYLAKTKVTEDKKESYQRRLEQLAFEQEVGGLKTSLADGFRSQQELQAAKLHHHLDVDREKYVKRHCYDKAAESQVKKNTGPPEAPAFLQSGPVQKIYSLKDNYARPAKDTAFAAADGSAMKDRYQSGQMGKQAGTSSDAADNKTRCGQ